MDVPAQKIVETSGWIPHLHLPPGLDLPTYHLTISLAFCLSLVWLVKRAEQLDLDRRFALDASLAIMVGGFVGARLLHIIYEAPAIYFADPRQIYRIWEGGFVWYGGALLGTAAGITVALKRKIPLEPYFDLFAPVAAFGYAVGRVACVLTGCCFGRLCYLSEHVAIRYPTQITAVLWELMTVGILLRLEKLRKTQVSGKRTAVNDSNRQAGQKVDQQSTQRADQHPEKKQNQRSDQKLLRQGLTLVVSHISKFIHTISARPGTLLGIWIFLHALGRILMEIFRADDRGPTIAGLSLSTSISLLLLFGSSLYLRSKRI